MGHRPRRSEHKNFTRQQLHHGIACGWWFRTRVGHYWGRAWAVRLLSGISSQAAAALAVDKPAQMIIMSRNPNTNASRTDSRIAAPLLAVTSGGNCMPASLISFAWI